jgi:hypothetical protein
VTTPLPDTAALRALAERARDAEAAYQAECRSGFDIVAKGLAARDACDAFRAALTPAVVLALLDRAECWEQWASQHWRYVANHGGPPTSRATPSERGQAETGEPR